MTGSATPVVLWSVRIADSALPAGILAATDFPAPVVLWSVRIADSVLPAEALTATGFAIPAFLTNALEWAVELWDALPAAALNSQAT